MSERRCPACAEPQPPSGDFCVNPDCREYLAWDLPEAPAGAARRPPAPPVGEPVPGSASEATATAIIEAPPPLPPRATGAPPPPAAGARAPAATPHRTPVVVALLDEAAGEGRLSVHAGKELVLKALVRNQGEIVDAYDLDLVGLPEESWWEIEPATVYLLPFDTRERFDQEVEVRLHPPRTWKATAFEPWKITITATSRADPAQMETVSTSFQIEPFDELQIAVDPERTAGRRGGELELRVTNESNHKLEATLEGEVEDHGCSLSFLPAKVELEAGESKPSRIQACAVKPQLVGRASDHQLTLRAIPVPDERTAEADRKKPPSHAATFRQRAWLPWWSSLLLAAALVAGGLYLRARLERVPVPNVIGQPISPARAELGAAGVKGEEMVLVSKRREVPTGKRDHPYAQVQAGDVFEEVPHQGTLVAPHSKVKLYTDVKVRPPERVPNLYDLSQQAAETSLAAAGYALGDVVPYPPPPGSVVIRQAPRARKKVPQTQEAVYVRMGQVAAVPDVIGEQPDTASQTLRSAGLILGTVKPRKPRRTEVIAKQEPTANVVEPVGSAVNVTLGPPPVHAIRLTKAKRHLHVAPRKSAGTRAKSTPAAAAAPLPALGAQPAAAAAATLAKAGIQTRRTLAVNASVPAGRLLRTEPAAGTKIHRGAVVTLVVSAGFPEIAVDNGHSVLALDGVTGKPLARIATGPEQAVEPSWSPDGRSIAYVSNGRIVLTSAQSGAGPVALSPAGERFAAPTFPSSASAPAIIAAVRQLADGAQELCLLRIPARAPSCIAEPGWTLGDAISWSPTGRELLVAASRPSSSPAVVGLLAFTSRVPFSTSAASWGMGRLATPTVNGAGVLAGTFSPDGERIALVEDFGAFPSVALVAPSDLALTKAERLTALTSVCAVQWRTDGAELLVQVDATATAAGLGCTPPLGALYRVDPARPGALSFLARGVAHPSWQPLPGVD